MTFCNVSRWNGWVHGGQFFSEAKGECWAVQDEVYFWPRLVPARIFRGPFCQADRHMLRMFPASWDLSGPQQPIFGQVTRRKLRWFSRWGPSFRVSAETPNSAGSPEDAVFIGNIKTDPSTRGYWKIRWYYTSERLWMIIHLGLI